MDQQFLLDIILNSKAGERIDIKKMKGLVQEYSKQVQEDKEHSNFDQLRDDLKSKVLIMTETKPAAGQPGQPAATPPADGAEKKPDDKKAEGDKKKDKKADKDKDAKAESDKDKKAEEKK